MTANRRTYRDPCGIARGLDVIGDRWALLIARELLLGPKRFTDLRGGLPHLGPDVLAQRLRELEQAGVVRRAALPPPAASRVYELTDWGRELEPVLLALGRWGRLAPLPTGRGELSADACVIALMTTFEPAAAEDLQASIELHLGESVFRLSVSNGRLRAASGPADAPDATIDTDPSTLVAVLWHGRPLEDAVAADRLRVAGERSLLSRFLELFRGTGAAAR